MSSIKLCTIGAAFVALSYLAYNEGTTRKLREFAAYSVNHSLQTTTTITPLQRDELDMLEIPTSTSDDIPPYLALCQEWIRHDADYQENEAEDQRVVKDVNICLDWSAPHFSLLEIFSALMVSRHTPRIQYCHSCEKTQELDAADNWFDMTTIQQIMSIPQGSVHANPGVLSVEDLKHQCKRCLLSYDGEVEASRIKAKAFHHCFAWPEDTSNLRQGLLMPTGIPYVPYSFSGVTPLSSAIVAVREILYATAVKWQETDIATTQPKNEHQSGVVYWIDPTTVGLRYEDVMAEISLECASISVLASPLCMTAILPTGEKCLDYGQGLAAYLKNHFSHLPHHEAISFQILTSTAAAYSRMILAQWLICPPRSSSCLLPAVTKMTDVNQAIVLEDPAWGKSIDFMAIAGHHGAATTKVLSADKIPPIVRSTSRTHTKNFGEEALSATMHMINTDTDSEGYPRDDGTATSRPAIPSDETIYGLSPHQTLNNVAIAIVRFKANANLLQHNHEETVPTLQQVKDALARHEPLLVNNNNSRIKDIPRAAFEVQNDFRHAELATDFDSGRVAQSPTKQYYEDSTARRYESMLRMQYQPDIDLVATDE